MEHGNSRSIIFAVGMSFTVIKTNAAFSKDRICFVYKWRDQVRILLVFIIFLVGLCKFSDKFIVAINFSFSIANINCSRFGEVAATSSIR